MHSKFEICGFCAPRFARVRDAFARNFEENDEVGAGFSVFLSGEPVVDLWGGMRDRAGELPWQQNTLVNVFSATKGITALCAIRLIEQGLLNLDAPVAQYWPEFAAHGKQELTVRLLLNHRSGLSALKQEVPSHAIYDWATMIVALQEERPWWPPDSKQGYQAFTFGWLVGEVIRRVTGQSVGQYFREQIGDPLGINFFIGLQPEQLHAVADVARLKKTIAPEQIEKTERSIHNFSADTSKADDISLKAFMNPPSLSTGTNSSAWRQCEIPSANGHGTARSLACIYGGLANGGIQDGVRLLQEPSIAHCYNESSADINDAVLLAPMRFSLGFMLGNHQQNGMHLGRGKYSFGHTGTGGSVGFADPDHKLGIGYVTNRLGKNAWIDPRADNLITALYDAI